MADPEWSQVPLREYIEALINERDKALSLLRQETERRLGQMNELREQISEERGRYVTREVYDDFLSETSDWRRKLEQSALDRQTYDIKHAALEARVKTLEQDSYQRVGSERSRLSVIQPWQIAIAGFGITLLITLIVIVTNVLTSQ